MIVVVDASVIVARTSGGCGSTERLGDVSPSRHVDPTGPVRTTRPGRAADVPLPAGSASYGGVVAKHFVDQTAEFKMPLPGRHAAADSGELEATQRFDPGFSRRRPAVPNVPPRDDKIR